jgi:4-methyl-5(b-hydroxyethyl)-thiazole monophosphate biosynthesis
MPKVLIPIATGFEEIEAVGLIDVMRRGGIDVTIAYLGGEFESDIVVGGNGISIKADADIRYCIGDDYDMIVLPGGYDGTANLMQNEQVIELLREFKSKDKWIGAICAAPLVLEKAGVLNETFTCYPAVSASIKSSTYTDKEKVVISGKVMTSRGPSTAICFGLAIVKALVGNESSNDVKEGMLVDFC